MAGNGGRREQSTSEGIAVGRDVRTVRRAKGQPNRVARRLIRRRGTRAAMSMTGVVALGAGSMVASGGIANPSAAAAASPTTNTVQASQPPSWSESGTITSANENVTLPNASWVQQQLANPNLSSSEKTWLDHVPIEEIVSSQPSTGDPVASGGCAARDIVGVTDWSFNTYEGFSTKSYKDQVSSVSHPNYSHTTLPLLWSYQGADQLFEQPVPPATTVETENQGKFQSISPIVLSLTDLCDVYLSMVTIQVP